jgi:hypothetical protein
MRKTLSFSMLVALVLASSAALAGFTQPAPVAVDLTERLATGDMATSRYTKGQTFIGCGVRTVVTAGGVVTFGFCQAGDAEGDEITCFTENAELLDVMKATGDFSFIVFAWTEDEEGGAECTRIGFSTQSFYLPKGLKANKGTPVDEE